MENLADVAMNCTREYFFSNATEEDKCHVATCYDDSYCCSSFYNFFNFYQMSWCWFGGTWYLVVLITFFLILIIFRFISSLVEDYLAPAVAYIAQFFNMSEAMGAVTVLALANGKYFEFSF